MDPLIKNNNIYDSFIFLGIILLAIYVFFWLKFKLLTLKFSPLFDWWNNNGGQKYNNFFNITGALAAYDSYMLFQISKFSGNAINILDVQQIQFLFDKVFPYTLYTENGVVKNFVLPSHLTRDIKFSKTDGNLYFNKWLRTNNLDTDIILDYDKDNKKINNGVYPGIMDLTGWKNKFQEWGVKTWDNQPDSPLIVPRIDTDVLTEWINTKKHPDNFLACYGILPDAPLAVCFINNYYTDPVTGVKLDTVAFSNLCGGASPANPGGWIGFLSGLSDATKKDDYISFLYSKYAIQIKTAEVDPASICDPPSTKETLEAWAFALMGGIGIASGAAMLGPVGAIAVVVGGLIVGGMSIGSFYAPKPGC